MGGEEPEVGQDDINQITKNPQRVSRRSIRSGSEVRHGRVYEDPGDTTIRAVTPDSASSTTVGFTDHSLLQSSPAPINPYKGQGSVSGWEASTSVSNTDEESTAEARRRKGHKKPKSRGATSSDASPSSFISKTRKRIGSITTSAQVSGRQDESYGSLAYPTTNNAVPFPTLVDVRNQLPRPLRRTFSSDTAVGADVSSIRSPLFLNTDSGKILHLMKTTCGRMHGILFFRPLNTSAWESGYCAINVAPGSLVCQKQGELSSTKTLLPDLRGCSVRTNYDSETQSTFISVVLPSVGFGYQLRPPVPETFDSWLAALLCWQPLRPKGVHNKMMKPQSVTIAEKRPVSQRRVSDMATPKSTAIIKVGRMLLWDGPIPAGSQRHISKRGSDFDSVSHVGPWRHVSCTLHENGTFKLLTEVDTLTICSVRLSRLARCSVQRLNDSVLDAPHCLAIYPHYNLNSTSLRTSKPLFLGLESQNAFEAWYVLLRALTAPELYGPEGMDVNSMTTSNGHDQRSLQSSMFRIERNLQIKIVEGKFPRDPVSEITQGPHGMRTKYIQRNFGDISVYADVIFDRDLHARTASKTCTQSAFWAEEFFLPDLPPILSTVSIVVKVGNPSEQEWTMVADDAYDIAGSDVSHLPNLNGIEVASSDPAYGKIDIPIDELEQDKVIEKWWQLADKHGRVVGSILMKLALSETIVLMESEYNQMSVLLHTFDNGLTTQLAHVLGQELKQLSEILLDIFQASNSASEWINTLIEEEIDGIYKETPPVRMRFSGRIHSNDSYETAEQREVLVRDLSRSATMEANLLFRGNSLVTKALDAHMRRLGKQYLEETLGETLRQILVKNPDCEVDPSRIRSAENREKNWSTLITLTNDVWKAIAGSARKCPPGMRMVFKHIKSCAEDRYGSFIRTVKYTSVSGFLFLRFFCPAILNPKLFGLIEDHPPDRARRTFTLIAKSLNVLASMARFGTKETWMEPMNRFLLAATPEFKAFIEEISSMSSLETSNLIEPQFQAPIQIRARLAQTSREGLPSLPYLLDAPKSMAALVDLWVAHAPKNMLDTVEESIRTFHQICLDLRRMTSDCMAKAEPAEKPNTNLEPQWQQLLNEQNQKHPISNNPFEDTFGGLLTDTDITALPQRGDSARTRPRHTPERSSSAGATITLSSSTSGVEARRVPYTARGAEDSHTFAISASSSTVSFDNHNDGRRVAASRDGSSKARLLDYLNPARKKTRSGFGAGDRMTAEPDDDDDDT